MSTRVRNVSKRGVAERRRSHVGRARLPDLRQLYRHALPRITPGDYEFSFELLGANVAPVVLDTLLDSATWTEDSATPTGHLTVRRPDPDRPHSLIVQKGMLVRCRTRPGHGGPFIDLWTMRILDPQVDPVAGVVDFDVTDDMEMLTRNRRDWVFRKTKKRKRGYTLQEVVAEVARREGIRVGRVFQGTHRMSFTKKNASALEVLRFAAQQEKGKTGAQLLIRLVNRRIEVVPLERNRVLYEFKDQIDAVTLAQTAADRPITVLLAKGHLGKGKAVKKLRATVSDRAVVRKLGRVVQEKDYGHVSSLAELMRLARRDLAKGQRVKRTASMTVRGVPFIRRGEGIRWLNTEPGWYGREDDLARDRTFVFATAVTHTVSGADYTTDLALTQADPFLADERAQDAAKRKAAAKRRRARRGKHKGHA